MSRSASLYGISTWIVPAVLRVGEELQRGARAGDVLAEHLRRAARAHVGGAGEQRRGVDARSARRAGCRPA